MSFKVLDFHQNFLRLVNVSIFCLILSLSHIKVNLLLELVYSPEQLLSLEVAHFVTKVGLIISNTLRVFKKLLLEQGGLFNLLALNSVVTLYRVLGSCQGLFDFVVNLINHSLKMIKQVSFVKPCIRISFGIYFKHLF